MQGTAPATLRLRVLEGVNRLGLAWRLTVGVLLVDVAWLLASGWSVSLRGLAGVAFTVAVICAPLAIGRYRRDPRIHATVCAAALLIVFQAAGATLSYLVVATNAALVDASLAAWDRALGFDWLAMHTWVQGRPWVDVALRAAYHTGLLQLAFVVLFLGLSGRAAQLATFMRLFIVTTLATVVVSGLLPAAGPWKAAPGAFDASVMSHFELLRSGGMRHIPLQFEMQGLISFPSLHAALAVLCVHAMRGTRLLPMFFALNLAMLVSTPVVGGHYLVDLLAGVALVVALVLLDGRRHASAAGRRLAPPFEGIAT